MKKMKINFLLMTYYDVHLQQPLPDVSSCLSFPESAFSLAPPDLVWGRPLPLVKPPAGIFSLIITYAICEKISFTLKPVFADDS